MLDMIDAKQDRYVINVTKDYEVNRWCATSDDIPGLVLETDTIDQLIQEIELNAPALIAYNLDGKTGPHLPISVCYDEVLHVA